MELSCSLKFQISSSMMSIKQPFHIGVAINAQKVRLPEETIYQTDKFNVGKCLTCYRIQPELYTNENVTINWNSSAKKVLKN